LRQPHREDVAVEPVSQHAGLSAGSQHVDCSAVEQFGDILASQMGETFDGEDAADF
jgi:hypothetical protein